jgi:Flp pilus assembly protein TadD
MWRNAAALSPNHPVVHLDLGLTLLDNGAYGESIEQIRQAIALKPDYAEAYGGLGAACTASGDTAGAEAAFEQSLNLAPDNYLALSRYGYLRIAEHRYGEAAVLLQKALRRAPGDAFSTLCMADLWEKMGDAQKALHFARAAIAIRPTYGEAYYLAALIILKGSPQDPAGIGYLRTAARLGFAPAIRKLEALFNR